MPEDKPLCEYCEVKHGKFSRCTSSVKETVYIDSEPVALCIYHFNIVKGMIKRRDEHKKLLDGVQHQIEEVRQLSEELRRKLQENSS